MSDEPSLSDQFKEARGAISDLTDGKLDKRDGRALVVLSAMLAALIAAAVSLAGQAGLLPEVDEVGATDGDTD